MMSTRMTTTTGRARVLAGRRPGARACRAGGAGGTVPARGVKIVGSRVGITALQGEAQMQPQDWQAAPHTTATAEEGVPPEEEGLSLGEPQRQPEPELETAAAAAAFTTATAIVSMGDDEFPDEALALICSFVDLRQLGRLACVSRRFTEPVLTEPDSGAKQSVIQEGARLQFRPPVRASADDKAIPTRLPDETWMRALWRTQYCISYVPARMVEVLKQLIDDVAIQAAGWPIVCRQSDAGLGLANAYGNSIGAANGVGVVVAALQQYVLTPDVAEHVLQATWILCRTGHSLDHRGQFTSAGGIDAILQTMAAHIESSTVQSKACRALATVTAGRYCDTKAVVCAGGIHAIVAAMSTHSGAEATQQWGCAVLHNVAKERDASWNRELKEAGAIQLAQEVQTAHPGTTASEYARYALRNLY